MSRRSPCLPLLAALMFLTVFVTHGSSVGGQQGMSRPARDAGDSEPAATSVPAGGVTPAPSTTLPVRVETPEEADRLLTAADAGDLPTVRQLLDSGSSATGITTQDRDRGFPLMAAVSGGHLEVARLLLERGADVNKTDRYRFSPLHRAARGRDVALVKLLLDNGANCEAKTMDGGVPLHKAAAGSSHNFPIAALLIERGCNVNVQENDGWGPLHAAAYYRNRMAVTLLLDAGADVNLRTNQGETPLKLARGRDTEVLEILRARGGTE